MRVIKKSFEQSSKNYKLVSEYEIEHNLLCDVENGLSTIFLLSQNLPLKSVSGLFSGENFPLTECFEELETSYHLIKYGFYKQSMISLRTSLEIGLLSVYWAIDYKDFKEWFSSKLDTPFNNRVLKKILSDEKILSFDKTFNLIEEIRNLGLSDFVHTKGVSFSNFGEISRYVKGRGIFENYKEWLKSFKDIVRVLVILHLLKFPTLNIRFSTKYLLSKFGTFESIPFGVFGDEMDVVDSLIPEKELSFITKLTNSDIEVIEIKKRIDELPELTETEIGNKVLETQKSNIEMSSFENWISNIIFLDNRITPEMILTLKEWATTKNLLTIQNILDNNKIKSCE